MTVEKSDLYIAIGVAAIITGAAIAAYILTKPRPMFTSFTRDGSGRVVEIIERPLR